MISSELHLSVFSTEKISSDKRSIYISDTLSLLYFVKNCRNTDMIRIFDSCVDPNPLMVERQGPDNFTFSRRGKGAHGK